MAIEVGYFENQKPEHYIEGPFVYVQKYGFQIEMKNTKNKYRTPVLYNKTALNYCQQNNIVTHRVKNENCIRNSVDFLNCQYKIGNLIVPELAY